MSKAVITFCLLYSVVNLSAQGYISYFTGNTTDSLAQAQGGVCLAGGATEDDNAMIWFLNRASGGDILVLRASGSDGYNDYFYSDLGVAVNSVETIRFENASANNDPYVLDKINKAEAIWFAGGDQWDYISYWRNSPVAQAINSAISERNIVIGGTSAGMAILGSHYFSAEEGTVTSNASLNNPYDDNVTPDGTPFLHVPFLENVITDTHYDNPDRRGRHTVFLARILTDSGIEARGIACDEYTHVCIDENGIARIFGDFPNYDDIAYFIHVNCELDNPMPETCIAGNPLTWNHGGTALLVYEVQGTPSGANTFDLNTWNSGTGGVWKNWAVDSGIINFSSEIANPNCDISEVFSVDAFQTKVYPNPVEDLFTISFEEEIPDDIKLFKVDGKEVSLYVLNRINSMVQVDCRNLEAGIYTLEMIYSSGRIERHILTKK